MITPSTNPANVRQRRAAGRAAQARIEVVRRRHRQLKRQHVLPLAHLRGRLPSFSPRPPGRRSSSPLPSRERGRGRECHPPRIIERRAGPGPPSRHTITLRLVFSIVAAQTARHQRRYIHVGRAPGPPSRHTITLKLAAFSRHLANSKASTAGQGPPYPIRFRHYLSKV